MASAAGSCPIAFGDQILLPTPEFSETPIGVAEQLHGRLESARQHYEEARDRFEELDDRANLAYALTNLGELRFWAGGFRKMPSTRERRCQISKDARHQRKGVSASWEDRGLPAKKSQKVLRSPADFTSSHG